MGRPIRYTNPEAEQLVSMNPKAEAISAGLRQRTIERIDSSEANEVVEDPIGHLIEGARATS